MLATRLLAFGLKRSQMLSKASPPLGHVRLYVAEHITPEAPAAVPQAKTEIEKRQALLADEAKQRQVAAYTQYLREQNEKAMLVRKAPSPLKAYIKLMRLDKTAPIYLTYWPGLKYSSFILQIIFCVF